MEVSKDKRERLLEAAAVLLSAAKDKQLNTTNLNKAIFYLDLFALCHFGAPVTRSAFIALKQGPVVANYEKRLIQPLMEDGIAVQEQEGLAKPVRLVREPGSHFLSAEETKLARNVGAWISQMSAKEASRISHQNPGWKLAYEDGLGAGKSPLPIELCIAMQQVLDDDPWLKAECTGPEREAVAAAGDSEGEAW